MTQAAVAVLPERIQSLVETIQGRDAMDSRTAVTLLQESGITQQDLMDWADFGHPDADSYGRKMIFDGGSFELMAMSWVDGDMSAIHDHGYTQWGAVKVFGAAEHATFDVEGGVMRTTSRTVCRPGTVLGVDHDLIHQMGNIGQPGYLTLHLYGCPDRDCDVTADARLYDLDRNTVEVTTGGAFFALPEGEVTRTEDGPKADFPTWLRFVCELLKRSINGNASLDRAVLTDREAQLADQLFAPATWRRLEEEVAAHADRQDAESDCYRRVLARELLASARMQLRLMAAGVAGDALQSHAAQLTSLVESADPKGSQDFALAYRSLLAEAFG